MSKIEVDAIEPQSGTTLTIGASGDTITIPSGATLSSTDPLIFPAGTVSLPAITTTGDTNTGIFFPAADTIAFTEGGAEAMRITSDGTVGINKTSLQPFLVNGSRGSGMGTYPTWEATVGRNLALFETDQSEGTFVLGSPTNGYAQLGFADPAHKASGRIGYDHSADAMVFGTNGGTERMRIDSNGSLNVAKANYANNVSATNAGWELLANGNDPFIQHGNTGTGATTRYNFFNANGVVGSISTNGSATAYNTSSDYRLKENVNYDFDATTRLKQLKPARFNFIADADTTVDGFLAHEVQDIIPEAIHGIKDATETKEKVVVNVDGNVIAENIEQADWETGKIADEDGNTKYPTDSTWEATKVVPIYQGIDQAKLVPLLVKTIQELEARITTLENA
jgi:hypothetical protein